MMWVSGAVEILKVTQQQAVSSFFLWMSIGCQRQQLVTPFRSYNIGADTLVTNGLAKETQGFASIPFGGQ